MAKVESLHGTTPAEIFESGIENLDGIAAVVAAVLWKDGTVTAGWSNADAASVALMIDTLDEEHRSRNLRGGD
jgi:acetyl-CoA acetyltransferase